MGHVSYSQSMQVRRPWNPLLGTTPYRWAVLAICILVIGAGAAEAELHRVESDGSGDFLSIQAAIDAAAAGDTIQVGVGRFDSFHEYTFVGGGPVQCIASITSGPIVIRGISPESIVGPQFQRNELDGLQTTVFALDAPSSMVTIENLTIEKTWFGVIGSCQLQMQHCRIREMDEVGIALSEGHGTTIAFCEFERCVAGILRPIGGTSALRDLVVRGCSFNDGVWGMNVGGTEDALVVGCSFANLRVALQFFGGGSGTVSHCRFTQNDRGHLAATSGASVIANNSVLEAGAEYSCLVTSSAGLAGSRNQVGGGTVATLEVVGTGSSASLRDGNLLNGGDRTVNLVLTGGTGTPSFDLTNNYWGTSDPQQIAAWIHDANDQMPNLFVEFEPFLTSPVTNEQETMGSLKRRFKRQ